MDVKNSLYAINDASKKVFNISVPVDRIRVFVKDYDEYKFQRKKSLYNEITHAIVKGTLVFGEELNEIIHEIETMGGFHTPRIYNKKLASDITVLTSQEMKNPAFLLSNVGESYSFLETLSHEIGHAIMEQNMERGFFQVREYRKLAFLCGYVNDLYRELNELLPEDRKNDFTAEVALDVATQNASLKWAINMDKFMYSTYTDRISLSRLEIQLEDLEKSREDLLNMSKMRSKELELPKLPKLNKSHYNKSFLKDDNISIRLRKRLKDSDERDEGIPDRINFLIERLKKEREDLEKKEKKNQKIEEIASKIPSANIEFRTKENIYFKKWGIPLIRSEGWAVFYSNKIMEYLIIESVINTNKDLSRNKVKELLLHSPSKLIHDHPEVKYHISKTAEWFDRSDVYGQGMNFYAGLATGNTRRALSYAVKGK